MASQTPAPPPAKRSSAGSSAGWWAAEPAETLRLLGSSPDGLSDTDAADRLAADGPNRLEPRRGTGTEHELLRQFPEPIVLILLAATALALLLGDHVDAVIILAIVLGSGLLGFWREHTASVTVARLLEQVQIQVEVPRAGLVILVRPQDVVVGDVLVLNAGDVVPCDCRVLQAEALQVDESALTGETYPRHKQVDPAPAAAELAERQSALFHGSHVVSGQGRPLLSPPDRPPSWDRCLRPLNATAPRTSFEKGSAHFGLLLARPNLTGSETLALLGDLGSVGTDRAYQAELIERFDQQVNRRCGTLGTRAVGSEADLRRSCSRRT